MRSVVITGTSTGIGWSAAKVLVNNGFRVFGSVRKTADAERVAGELGPHFIPLVFDVTDAAGVKAAASKVRRILGGETLAGLVNNAGVAVVSPLLNLSIEKFRRQIDINLTGAVISIQAFAPLLGTDPELTGAAGRIVNISSMGGKIGVPFLAAYSASKSALEVLSHSLRRELLPFGIDVIVIVPGMVATPIWSKAEQFLDTRSHAYFKTSYEPAVAAIRRYINLGKHGLPPERLGQIVMHALIAANPKTSYKITRYPFPNEIDRYLPKRLVDRVLGRILGLRRRRI